MNTDTAPVLVDHEGVGTVMITNGGVFVRFYTLTGVSPRDTPQTATLLGPCPHLAAESHHQGRSCGIHFGSQ